MGQDRRVGHRALAMAGIDIGMGAEPDFGVRLGQADPPHEFEIGRQAMAAGLHRQIVFHLPRHQQQAPCRRSAPGTRHQRPPHIC
jgi:hypothetical protein